MYNRSQQSKMSSADYGSTNATSDPHDRLTNQVNTVAEIDLDMNMDIRQYFAATNVTVNLFDCMECYVRLARCQINLQIKTCNNTTQTDVAEPVEDSNEEQVVSFTTTMEIDFNRQLQEFREEQDNEPHNPPNTVGQLEVEEDLLSLAWDPEDFNFMEKIYKY